MPETEFQKELKTKLLDAVTDSNDTDLTSAIEKGDFDTAAQGIIQGSHLQPLKNALFEGTSDRLSVTRYFNIMGSKTDKQCLVLAAMLYDMYNMEDNHSATTIAKVGAANFENSGLESILEKIKEASPIKDFSTHYVCIPFRGSDGIKGRTAKMLDRITEDKELSELIVSTIGNAVIKEKWYDKGEWVASVAEIYQDVRPVAYELMNLFSNALDSEKSWKEFRGSDICGLFGRPTVIKNLSALSEEAVPGIVGYMFKTVQEDEKSDDEMIASGKENALKLNEIMSAYRDKKGAYNYLMEKIASSTLYPGQVRLLRASLVRAQTKRILDNPKFTDEDALLFANVAWKYVEAGWALTKLNDVTNNVNYYLKFTEPGNVNKYLQKEMKKEIKPLR